MTFMTDEPEVERQKSVLAADYDSSPAAYEAHWGPAVFRLAKNFVKDLPLSDARTILDVGAGTGAMLRHLLRTTRATIVGIDRSYGMLALAPDEALRAVMDAERLAFGQESFDAAVAMFVLFHLPDPVSALRGVRRTLKDGGTVAFTTWGDENPDFRAFEVFDEVLERYGAAEGRALYARYDLSDTAEKCAALLERSDFQVSSITSERMAHRWTIEHVVGLRTRFGYGRTRWESLDAEAREAAVEEGREALAGLAPHEMVLRDEVIYSIGTAIA